MADVIIKFIADTTSLEEAAAQAKTSIAGISGAPLQSVADKFDAVANAATASKEGVDALSSTVKNLGQSTAIGNLKTQWDGFNNSVDATAEKTTTVRTELAQLTNQLKAMALAGTANGPVYDQLVAKASALKNATIETQKQLAITGSQTPGLSALVKATQGVVGAFSLAQGTSALFGSKNKDLEETLVKVQGAMLILNGLTEIENTLLEANAIKVGAVSVANSVWAATNILVGDSLALIGVEAEGATAAVSGLLLASGVGAILVGLALLAKNWENVKNAIEGVSEAERIQNKIEDDAQAAIAKDTILLQENNTSITNGATAYNSRVSMLEKLKAAYPDLLAGMTVENSNSKKYADIINNQILPALKAKAIADAASAESIDIQTKINELTTAYGREMKNAANEVGGTALATAQYQDALGKLNIQLTASNDKQKENAALASQANEGDTVKQNLQLLKDYYSTQALLADNGSKEQFDAQKNALDQQHALQTRANQASLASQVEIDAQQALIDAQYKKDDLDLTNSYYDKKLNAAKDYQLSLLNIQKANGSISNEQFSQESYDATKAALDAELELYANDVDKKKEINIALNNLDAERTNELKAEFEAREKLIEDFQNNEAQAEFNKGLESNQDYQNQLFKITNDGLIQRLATEKLNGEERQAIINQINKNINDNEAQNIAYQLSIKNQTIDAENSLEAKGLNKDLDIIRQAFAVKLEVIKGQGQAEVALRLALIKERDQQIDAAEEASVIKQINNQGENSKAAIAKQFDEGLLTKRQYDAAILQSQLDTDEQIQVAQAAFGYDNTAINKKIAADNAAIDKNAAQNKLADQKALNEALKQSAIAVAGDVLDIASNFQQASTDLAVKASDDKATKEIAAQQRLLDAKLISQAQFDAEQTKANNDAAKRDAKLKHDQAVKDKQIAEFKIVIATAIAVANGLASPAVPPFPSAISAGIIGAAELAVVAAKPVPLAKGTENLQDSRGIAGMDSIPTMLMPGERVVPFHINRMLNNIPNSDLPELVEVYNMKTNAIQADFVGTPIGIGTNIDYQLLANHIGEAMEKQFKNMPRSNISIDKNGIKVIAIEGNNQTEYVNGRYFNH